MDFKKHKEKILFAAVLVLFVAFQFFGQSKPTVSQGTPESTGSQKTKDQPIQTLADGVKNQVAMVHIDGEVNHPGLYQIEDNTRLKDVIDQAGGLTERADSRQLNLALRLTDEMKIHIPAIGQETNGNGNQSAPQTLVSTNSQGTININRASKEELMELPGIGPSKADSILRYREEKAFKKIEDIMEVDGIGEKTFESLKVLITVN